MENIIKVFDSVHDNRILSYQADFAAHTLTVDSLWEDGRGNTRILFSGVLSHWFEHVLEENILFDLTEITVSCFAGAYRELLEKGLPYGFPLLSDGVRTVEQLAAALTGGGYRVFELCASLGLCGFVIAREIQVEIKEKDEP